MSGKYSTCTVAEKSIIDYLRSPNSGTQESGTRPISLSSPVALSPQRPLTHGSPLSYPPLCQVGRVRPPHAEAVLQSRRAGLLHGILRLYLAIDCLLGHLGLLTEERYRVGPGFGEILDMYRRAQPRHRRALPRQDNQAAAVSVVRTRFGHGDVHSGVTTIGRLPMPMWRIFDRSAPELVPIEISDPATCEIQAHSPFPDSFVGRQPFRHSSQTTAQPPAKQRKSV